jgi:hypothetical protein
MNASSWTQAKVSELAQRFFPRKAADLERFILELATRHETNWRDSYAGVFRPTPTMYALALSWELKRLGPRCSVCKRKVEFASWPYPPGSTLYSPGLAPRTSPQQGGLNVPQNLQFGHAGCLPRQ